MIRLFCDACGTEITGNDEYPAVYISNQNGDRIFQQIRFDLCPDCLEALRQTLKAEKKFDGTTDVNNS